jgi:hypothetical protein
MGFPKFAEMTVYPEYTKDSGNPGFAKNGRMAGAYQR